MKHDNLTLADLCRKLYLAHPDHDEADLEEPESEDERKEDNLPRCTSRGCGVWHYEE